MKKIGVILSLFFYVSVCEIKAQDLITLPDKPVFTDIIEYSYDYDDFYGKTNKIEHDTAWLGADNKYAEISADAWRVAVKENYFIINRKTIYYKNGQTQSIKNILKDYISKTSNAEIKDVFDKLIIHVEKFFENQIVLEGTYYDQSRRDYKFYYFIVKLDAEKPEVIELVIFTRDLSWFWVLEIFYADNGIYLIYKNGDVFFFAHEEGKFIQAGMKKYNTCIINNIESHIIPFENDDKFIELYDFSTGKSKILGKHIKDFGHEAVLFHFRANDGKEYIINQENNKITRKPDEPCADFFFINNGYVYYNGDAIVVCLTDAATKKLTQYRISGTSVRGEADVEIAKNKLFITNWLISYMIDINNGEVLYSVYTEPLGGNGNAWVHIVPFGNKEIIFAVTASDK
jgi:hypothetical protein